MYPILTLVFNKSISGFCQWTKFKLNLKSSQVIYSKFEPLVIFIKVSRESEGDFPIMALSFIKSS